MNKSLVKIPLERVEGVILLIRSEKVILDTDLAELYGVETRALIQAVKRNSERFPTDFMFQLTGQEFQSLRSQFVISKRRGGRRYKTYAFTEHFSPRAKGAPVFRILKGSSHESCDRLNPGRANRKIDFIGSG